MYTRALTALFATALVLGGCAGESETKLEPGQKAFVFESGVVPIGDFDPWALELDELFDPCNEISDEEFKRAGFTGVKKSSSKGEAESPYGTSVCTFQIDDGGGFTVSSVHANREMAMQARTLRTDITSTHLPEMYLYQETGHLTGGNPCIAQIDTKQGAIAVGFITRYKNYSADDTCLLVKEKLEALYLLNK